MQDAGVASMISNRPEKRSWMFLLYISVYYITSYSTILYYIILLYCIILYCIILYYIALYYIILYYIILYYIILYYIILYILYSYELYYYCIISYHIILYYIIWYYIILYHIILYYIYYITFYFILWYFDLIHHSRIKQRWCMHLLSIEFPGGPPACTASWFRLRPAPPLPQGHSQSHSDTETAWALVGPKLTKSLHKTCLNCVLKVVGTLHRVAIAGSLTIPINVCNTVRCQYMWLQYILVHITVRHTNY